MDLPKREIRTRGSGHVGRGRLENQKPRKDKGDEDEEFPNPKTSLEVLVANKAGREIQFLRFEFGLDPGRVGFDFDHYTVRTTYFNASYGITIPRKRGHAHQGRGTQERTTRLEE